MITVLMDDCNGFSQDLYKRLIDSLQLHMVECTCGKNGCLIFFGHYRRLVKYLSNTVCLCIQRVFCKECGKTNALLPSLLAPYSQIPLRDQQEILYAMDSGISPEPVMERNNLIDENHIKYIFSQFKKHWKQRLFSLRLSLLDDLTSPCLAVFSRQFMQIHRTRNRLCTFTNTPLPDTVSRIPYDSKKHTRRILLMTLKDVFSRLHEIDQAAQALIREAGFSSDTGCADNVPFVPDSPDTRFLKEIVELLLDPLSEMQTFEYPICFFTMRNGCSTLLRTADFSCSIFLSQLRPLKSSAVLRLEGRLFTRNSILDFFSSSLISGWLTAPR